VKRSAPTWLSPARLGETLRGGSLFGGSWRQRFSADPTPRIGLITAEHADRLATIHASAFARPWSAEDFIGFVSEAGIRVEGLFVGRSVQPAGFVVTRCVLDEAEILSLALAREMRGRGHSRMLLAYHLQNLAHAGIRHVHLEVEEGNLPALALYRRVGFSQAGTRVGYYHRPDGTRANAFSMSLELA
jgi:ribosomal-protein-alanine N-acetyltransferase